MQERSNLAEKLSKGFAEGDVALESERRPILEKSPEYDSADAYKTAADRLLSESRDLLDQTEESFIDLQDRSPDKIDGAIHDLDILKEKLFKVEAFGVNHAYPDSSEHLVGVEEILDGKGKLGEKLNERISQISNAIFNLQRIRKGMAINLKGESLPLAPQAQEIPTKVAFSGGNTAPALFEEAGRKSLAQKQEEAKKMPSWSTTDEVGRPKSFWRMVKGLFSRNK